MSVIVNDNMPLDLALRLLWREAMREGIIQKLQSNRYFVSRSQVKHDDNKIYAKIKRRKRSAARRNNS